MPLANLWWCYDEGRGTDGTAWWMIQRLTREHSAIAGLSHCTAASTNPRNVPLCKQSIRYFDYLNRSWTEIGRSSLGAWVRRGGNRNQQAYCTGIRRGRRRCCRIDKPHLPLERMNGTGLNGILGRAGATITARTDLQTSHFASPSEIRWTINS
jgi:hypothetical protein